MLDSDFWRDLAEKFRPLDPLQLLRADWYFTAKIGEQPPTIPEWHWVGTDRRARSIQCEFAALASRGGPKIYPYMDSLTGWFEALRASGFAENQPVETEQKPDGTIVAHAYHGIIASLCQSSVVLCKRYESIALETERMQQIHDEAQIHAEEQKAYKIALENFTIPRRPEEPAYAGLPKEEDGWFEVPRADWRDDAAYAQKCPPFLRPTKVARLEAITVLRKKADEAVQSMKPQTPQELERCMWPAFSEYAEHVFDKMAEASVVRQKSCNVLLAKISLNRRFEIVVGYCSR